MELIEGLHIIKKMCKAYGPNCTGCPLLDNREESCADTPMDWTGEQIRDLVAAAEDWKEKHKPKTWLEVLLERLPNAELTNGVPSLCPFGYFGGNAPVKVGLECFGKCRECWNNTAPDEYQDEGVI